ncbi:MAG: cation transporter [Bacteroidota bacterium]|nr:cation transporter [Bacteroidota bacterium]
MKTLNIYAVLLLSIFSFNFSFAQTSVKSETIKVWGNCGMCKNKIEKSAKAAGATDANWNEKTKILNVSYNPAQSSSEKIQKSIAASGYDTQGFKADDKSYNKLMSCCKYDRSTATTNIGKSNSRVCKNPEACKDKSCYKNGKCDENACKDMAECKSTCCSN